MEPQFDPYQRWLEIPPEEQPPHHYRLLDLRPFESNVQAINEAADRQMGRIKAFQTGRHIQATQEILNQIAAAKVCLLNPLKKQQYDLQLQRQLIKAPPLQQPALMSALPPTAFARPVPINAPVAPPMVSPLAANDSFVTPVYAAPVKRRRNSDEGLLVFGLLGLLVVGGVGGFLVFGRQGQTKTSPSTAPALAENPGELRPELKPEGPQQKPLIDVAVIEPPKAQDQALQPKAPPVVPAAAPPAVVPEVKPAEAQRVEVAVVEPRAIRAIDKKPADKPSIPDMDAQDEAMRIVQATYKDILADPNDPTAAEKFYRLGIDTKRDLPGRYVLLKLASDRAVTKGDCKTAMKAIGAICDTFACDAASLKAKVLSAVIGKVATIDQSAAVAENILAILPELIAIGDLELAAQMAQYGVRAARAAGDIEIIKRVMVAAAQALDAGDLQKTVTAAQQALVQNVADPNANELVGLFLCFIKDDWAAGLPLLAKSKNVALRDVAALELTQPDKMNDWVALSDAWWELSTSGPANWRDHFRRRATYWSTKALPMANALMRLNLERRIEKARGVEDEFADEQLARAEKIFPKDAHQKSEQMILDGLRALNGDPKGSLEKLLSAARLDSERGQGDFVLACVYLLAAKKPDLANRHFEACLRRNRDNSAILNNLAISELRLGQNSEAVVHWKAALTAGATPELGLNISRLLREVETKRIVISGPALSNLRSQFAAQAQNGVFANAANRDGNCWHVMLPPVNEGALDNILSKAVAELLTAVIANITGEGNLLDRSCIVCRGDGLLECPMRGCKQGGIMTTQRVVVAQNPSTGDPIWQDQKVRVPCGNCSGQGQIPCRACFGNGVAQ